MVGLTPSASDAVLLRRDALAYGMNDRELRRLVRGGQLVRIRHGAYVDAAFWAAASPERQHLMRAAAVFRTAGCECVLSHTSAALCLGADVWDLDTKAVHLSRFDHKAGRRDAGVVQHCGLLTLDEVTERAGLRCTNAVRTALDITTITDVEHALVVVSSILHKGLATAEDLRDGVSTMTHVPGSLTTDLVLRLADARFDGPGEARTFHALWRQGVEAPVPQYPVRDGYGRSIAFLDFAWPQYGVWLEFDGRLKYERLLKPGETASDVVVREKRREDLVRRLTGWICVRVTWADLNDPARIATLVRQAMADQSRRVAT
jgi:hypothetical protein